jgi:hypothetical protein
LALAEFTVAASYDSGFAPPLYHLAETAVRRGDLAQADDVMKRFQGFDPDSTRWRELTIMYWCVKDGPAAVPWQTEAAKHPAVVLQAGRWLSVGMAQGRCAEGAYRALLSNDSLTDFHWGAFLGLHGVIMSQRRYADLPALIDSAVAVGVGRAPAMYLLDAVLGAPVTAKAAQIDSAWRAEYGDAYTGVSLGTRIMLAGWLAHQGDTTRLKKLRSSLLAERTSRLPLRRLLDGHLALARADTAAAVSSFRGLRINATGDDLDWGLVEPLALERLVQAKLALDRDRFAEAQQIAADFDHPAPVAFLPFVSLGLSIRLRAAQELGQPDQIARYQSRLRRLQGLEEVALAGKSLD